MNVSDPGAQVTELLQNYAKGDRASLNAAVPLVYEELKRLARAQLRRSSAGQQLQTTLLVHEAYEKLVLGQTQEPVDRSHFFAIAARAMRQIVVDQYRSAQAAKRGGGALPATLETQMLADGVGPQALLSYDRALTRLASDSPELGEVIELTTFGGFTPAEVAELTGTTVRTVQRKIARARAWMSQYLDADPADGF